MTYKTCTSCEEEKQLSEFRKDKTQKSGYQPRCKVCARLSSNAHYQRYKEKTVNRNISRQQMMRRRLLEYKEQKQCEVCGETETVCLDFHHINPDKKDFALSQITTQSWENIMAEVNKCAVVCKNCHTKIHAGVIIYEGPVV